MLILSNCHARAPVSFKYDPFGRRIYKSSSAGTSIYAYDGDDLIEETNASGGVVARYTQQTTDKIDEPVAMLRSGPTSYYQADGLGSITSLSSTAGAAGALAQTYTFDSFGNQTASSGSLTNSFRYTAREFYTKTNLYFYRARYYTTARLRGDSLARTHSTSTLGPTFTITSRITQQCLLIRSDCGIVPVMLIAI